LVLGWRTPYFGDTSQPPARRLRSISEVFPSTAREKKPLVPRVITREHIAYTNLVPRAFSLGFERGVSKGKALGTKLAIYVLTQVQRKIFFSGAKIKHIFLAIPLAPHYFSRVIDSYCNIRVLKWF